MTREDIAQRIMLDFAHRTGLDDASSPPVRYLWTDAFAVCNFLGRFVERQDDESLQLALRLVDQTHHVLGRHRSDDPRTGWLSGLSEADGEIHPTCGGLRIGKPRPESAPDEPESPASEWDRDGQYFHYLTRWMHALEQVACVTRDVRYHRQACELARAAHAGFVHGTPSGRRVLVWKMSIDLSRPQVASTGLHDALDGFITFSQLQASADRWGPQGHDVRLDLRHEIEELAEMLVGQRWETDDPLGLGGLLCDAHRFACSMAEGIPAEAALLERLLTSALSGLDMLARRYAFEESPARRLAFRELGLSIGLHAAQRMDADALGQRARELQEAIAAHAPLAGQIESCWLDPEAQACTSWQDHLDINAVMLATSLAPAGYLGCGTPDHSSQAPSGA